MKVINSGGREYWVDDATTLGIYRDLSVVEVMAFKDWANEHLADKVEPFWHPVVQDHILRKRAVVMRHVRSRG